MGKSLVIVESPAKARTIAGYLGDGYVLGSSVGHIRDLPSKASDVPAADRKRFGALGVDVKEGFEPYYVVSPEKKKTISELKKHLADADELLLATDEDREGEAIAWHLVQVLKPKVPVRRMVFHEITKDAITRALDETRSIDERLVDAQETRRILDRLYGYEVSPVLWKKVTRGLSAGRVQSVATRLVVQRERERMAFRSRRVLGPSRDLRSRRRSRRVSSRSTARGSHRAGTSSRRRASCERRRGPARRSPGSCARGEPRRLDLRGPFRRRAAIPAQAGCAVPHGDAPAGGQQEAPLLRADDDARRSAPLRSGLHHVHADRLDDALRVGDRRRSCAGRRALRRGFRAGEAAPVRTRGRERPGGARSDPTGGRHLQDAEGARGRAQPRRARALRPRMEADARVADGGRARTDGVASDRRHERRTARTSSSAPRAPSSPSAASSPPTSPARTSRRTTTRSASSRSSPSARRSRSSRSSPTSTRPFRRPATRSRRSYGRSRSAVSVGPRPTPRSCRRSSTAATCSRRERRSCPRSSRSRS